METKMREIIQLVTSIMKYRIQKNMKNPDVLNLNDTIQIVWSEWSEAFWLFWNDELVLEVEEDNVIQLIYDEQRFRIIYALLKRRAIKYGINKI